MNDRVQRTIRCDWTGCAHNELGFVFWMDDGPKVVFPDWIKNLRMVRVDDGTPQGKQLIYCSGDCEALAAKQGLHDPPRVPAVQVAQPGDIEKVAAAAAATENLKTDPKPAPKLEIVRD